MPETLSLDDIAAAARALGCELATVKAVIEVESAGQGFDAATGRPVILFEPHVFSRLTQRRYDESHPEISYKAWKTRPYPKTQAERWAQLEAAAALDRPAALQSASWGLFQVMGFNHAPCGFATPEAFAQAMGESERRQLDAFAAFVLAKRLAPALRERRWADFARAYNGAGYQANRYDEKLAAAYKRHGGRG